MRIPCPQCGGEVHLKEADGFPACPFCGAGLVLDRTGVRPHLLYRPRITGGQVLPLLRRWADRHGITASLGVPSPRLVYYPFWRYARQGPRRLVPAWSTLEHHWDEVRLPDAEQVFFDASHVQGAKVVEPTVPAAAARTRVFGEQVVPEGELVHLPVYEATMRLGEVQRSVAVEACSGTVVCSGVDPRSLGVGRMAGRILWLTGGGVVMMAAAIAVRPIGMAALVVAVLAVLLYGVLTQSGQGKRA